jgi:hypothetical protein
MGSAAWAVSEGSTEHLVAVLQDGATGGVAKGAELDR